MVYGDDEEKTFYSLLLVKKKCKSGDLSGDNFIF